MRVLHGSRQIVSLPRDQREMDMCSAGKARVPDRREPLKRRHLVRRGGGIVSLHEGRLAKKDERGAEAKGVFQGLPERQRLLQQANTLRRLSGIYRTRTKIGEGPRDVRSILALLGQRQ